MNRKSLVEQAKREYNKDLRQIEKAEIVQNQLKSLSESACDDIMEMVDAAREQMAKARFKAKEKAVLCAYGRSLHPITINKAGKTTEVYKVSIRKKQFQASTYEGIIDKLAIEFGITEDGESLAGMTIAGIFEKALYDKEITDNVKESTLYHMRCDFNRFFSEDFKNRRITDVTDTYLKAYTMEMVNDLHPKNKAFKAYKGVLNLIFGYAVENDIILKNPVLKLKNKAYLKSCDNSIPAVENRILTKDELDSIIKEVKERNKLKKYAGYYVHGFMVRLAIVTGMRVGELCSLKVSDIDIKNSRIHIHSQQLRRVRNGRAEYYYEPSTKDEKGISKGGRYFPITPQIKDILDENEECKNKLHIESEYVFCDLDGRWVKTKSYESFLARLFETLDMDVNGNHTFRRSLNSNVLIPKGIPVTERARLLGHSVETNFKHYSYAGKDNLDSIRDILSGDQEDENSKEMAENKGSQDLVTTGHKKIVSFSEKKKAHKPAKHKAL